MASQQHVFSGAFGYSEQGRAKHYFSGGIYYNTQQARPELQRQYYFTVEWGQSQAQTWFPDRESIKHLATKLMELYDKGPELFTALEYQDSVKS